MSLLTSFGSGLVSGGGGEVGRECGVHMAACNHCMQAVFRVRGRMIYIQWLKLLINLALVMSQSAT